MSDLPSAAVNIIAEAIHDAATRGSVCGDHGGMRVAYAKAEEALAAAWPHLHRDSETVARTALDAARPYLAAHAALDVAKKYQAGDTGPASDPVAAAARGFAEAWYELLTTMPDDYGCHMNCYEANTAADLFRALGRNAQAADILAAHAEHDEEGDLHYTKPKGGNNE